MQLRLESLCRCQFRGYFPCCHLLPTRSEPLTRNIDHHRSCVPAATAGDFADACNDISKKNGLKGPEVLCGVVLTPEEWTPETGLVSAVTKVKGSTVASTFKREIEVCF